MKTPADLANIRKNSRIFTLNPLLCCVFLVKSDMLLGMLNRLHSSSESQPAVRL